MSIIAGFLLLLLGLPVYGFGGRYDHAHYRIEGTLLILAGFALLSIGLVASVDIKTRS